MTPRAAFGRFDIVPATKLRTDKRMRRVAHDVKIAGAHTKDGMEAAHAYGFRKASPLLTLKPALRGLPRPSYGRCSQS